MTGAPAAAYDVRAATADDARTIAGHRAAMFRDMGRLAPDDAGALAALVAATEAYLSGALADGTYAGWLAVAVPTGVVGGAGVQLRPIVPRPGPGGAVLRAPQALLLNVYTEPGWRRRGVAERLVRAAMAWADARGASSVALHASDAGRALYQRLGFRPTNEMQLHGAPAAPLTRDRRP